MGRATGHGRLRPSPSTGLGEPGFQLRAGLPAPHRAHGPARLPSRSRTLRRWEPSRPDSFGLRWRRCCRTPSPPRPGSLAPTPQAYGTDTPASASPGSRPGFMLTRYANFITAAARVPPQSRCPARRLATSSGPARGPAPQRPQRPGGAAPPGAESQP